MTRVELALILKTIDAHTKTYTRNYMSGESRYIDDVGLLKQDIMFQYENVMQEDQDD